MLDLNGSSIFSTTLIPIISLPPYLRFAAIVMPCGRYLHFVRHLSLRMSFAPARVNSLLHLPHSVIMHTVVLHSPSANPLLFPLRPLYPPPTLKPYVLPLPRMLGQKAVEKRDHISVPIRCQTFTFIRQDSIFDLRQFHPVLSIPGIFL